MFRSNPPVPRPAQPAQAEGNINYLSAQIQQLLALILPQPVVTVLAVISDGLYRALLGQSNNQPSYTSTLAPPLILLAVTYLSILFVYKSIRSFLGMLIFSLKWAAILGVIGFALAYHYGNGDVQQGAQSLAQQSGLSSSSSSSWFDLARNYPTAQQFVPLLSSIPANLGLFNTAEGGQSHSWFGQAGMAGSQSSAPYPPNPYGQANDGSRSSSRQYRDLRPSRQVDEIPPIPISKPSTAKPERRSRDAVKGSTAGDDLLGRLSRWMGADLSQQEANRAAEKKKRQ